MIDKYVRIFSKMFEEYGDPSLNPDKYDKSTISKYSALYFWYTCGKLRQVIVAYGVVPTVKETYDGNVEELISRIDGVRDLDSKVAIYISDEINDIDHLNRLKEIYPDKEIVIKWNEEYALIDDVISAIYMIDYYKSVIDDNMSPLEKIMMAYDIVKSHYYKDYDKKGTFKSREITQMVSNSYIVCVGYVAIFNRLLRELGIDASKLSIKTGQDGHAMSIMSVHDDKYGVHGVFVFDPTNDSVCHEYYYQFGEKKADCFNKKIDGFQKADSLSAYVRFLVPVTSYECVFSDSKNENIIFSNGKKIDKKLTHDMLHTGQRTSRCMGMSAKSFVILLYNVKIAEGYNLEDIPKLIQEALFISGYGYYFLETINSVLDSIKEQSIGKTA